MQNNTFSGLYLRQNLIVLEEVSSTNDYLKELLSNIKPLPEATAIMANHQACGRGQRGSTWISQPGQNLMVSFVLYPKNITIAQTFNLNMAICIGIQQWLAGQVAGATVKWPNDLYIHDRKIGGVLIENQLSGSRIRSSIIGIGLNINQLDFPDTIAQRATSLRLETASSSELPILPCCLQLLESVLSVYDAYDIRDAEPLRSAYNNLLYRRGVPSPFNVGNEPVQGTIEEVDASGRLIVMIDGERCSFDLKEIQFITGG
ncbi:MAG TPA: biotin--[acetyl-CoA-carboxylase] ligase [Sphingobacterium sp.]|nr:biotin--[acetyl-CoA-carboxylase] ligase [Sphingobacterium sp.]